MDISKELKQNLHDPISKLIINSKLKVPILGVKRETGSTSWHDEKLREAQRYAFGIPRWFTRFNFTSAINDVPFAYISWIKFTVENSPNNNYIQGYIGAQEWNDGPFIHRTDNINPFCSLDYIIPSRSYKSSIFNVILICINN